MYSLFWKSPHFPLNLYLNALEYKSFRDFHRNHDAFRCGWREILGQCRGDSSCSFLEQVLPSLKSFVGHGHHLTSAYLKHSFQTEKRFYPLIEMNYIPNSWFSCKDVFFKGCPALNPCLNFKIRWLWIADLAGQSSHLGSVGCSWKITTNLWNLVSCLVNLPPPKKYPTLQK